jgi:hypothetical protein
MGGASNVVHNRARVRRLAVLVLGVTLAISCKEKAGSAQRSAGDGLKKPAAAGLAGQLRDGDLIFQESTSDQSEMVRALTDSRWTHMGVIFQEPSGPIVLEAVSPVRRTRLKDWIARGRKQHHVIKRLRDAETRLSPDVIGRMRKLGDTWLGRAYDARFRWDDQTLYCSELAYKLFERAAGVRLGKLQTAAEMNLDDEKVRQALRIRFAGMKFDPAETVVTPDSIFNDEQLVEVEAP